MRAGQWQIPIHLTRAIATEYCEEMMNVGHLDLPTALKTRKSQEASLGPRDRSWASRVGLPETAALIIGWTNHRLR